MSTISALPAAAAVLSTHRMPVDNPASAITEHVTPAQLALYQHAASGVANPKDLGAAGNGTTDDRAALVAADALGRSVLLPAGTYLVNSNLTLSSPLVFTKGAILKPASGVTITLGASVQAPLTQIFDCSLGGSIVVASSPPATIEMNPVWFGASVGPFANDGTLAFQKCFASGASRFYIPRGQYDISGTITLTTQGRITVRGDGIESRIDFNPSANNTPMWKTVSGDTFVFQQFYCNLNNSGARTGIVCFDLADEDISAVWADLVFLNGFNRAGFLFAGQKFTHFDSCRFTGCVSPSGSLAVAVESTAYMNAMSFTRCRFNTCDKYLKTVGTYALTIDRCNFELGGTTSTLTVDALIDIAGATDPAAAFAFTNNYVEGEEPGGSNPFLLLTNVQGADISGNSFVGQHGGTAVTSRFITVQGATSRGVTVRGNRFDTCVNGFINAVNHVVRAYDNSFFQLGTGELTTHNAVMAKMDGYVELNNLAVTAVVDAPSIAHQAAYVHGTDIAMTGAALGDEIEASVNIDLQGLALQAYVRTAGQIRFSLLNLTGAAVDLASATYSFRLRRRDL